MGKADALVPAQRPQLPCECVHDEGELALIESALGTLLRSGAIDRIHRRIEDRIGIVIERSAYLVLRRIAEMDRVRPTDLARSLGVEPPTVSRHLRHLEGASLVVRDPDPTDRRAALVRLTDRGREIVTSLEVGRRALLGTVLGRWAPEDRRRFSALVARFAEDLAAESEAMGPPGTSSGR